VAPGQPAWGLFVATGAPDVEADGRTLLSEFGQRLAVGLAAARGRRERARVELLEDRDRIARDMHDHVIQRLFATGLSLQSAARLAGEPAVRDRIDGAVDEVDAVIKDIRHTIFALHREPGPRSLTAELSAICDSAVVSLGFAPTLSVQGSTSVLPDTMAADLLAVVREGLSNTARHARASRATVTVVVDRDVAVTVEDDGRGVPEGVSRSGLDNLARRATSRGGSFRIGPAAGPDGGGTELVWTVPLPEVPAGTFDPAR
jgi:signal transduction histidine kinase